MNKNRENIKWAPFESFFHSKDLEKEILEEKSLCSKPILSEDNLEILEKKVLSAYHTKAFIFLKFFLHGHIDSKKSYITFLDFHQRKIFLEDHTSIYFEQILDMKFL